MGASFLWASEAAVLANKAARVARFRTMDRVVCLNSCCFRVIICHLVRGSSEEPGRQFRKLRKPGSAAVSSRRSAGKGLHFVQPKAEESPAWQLSRQRWRGFSPERVARDREVFSLLGD